ncbi:MAG TPA: glycosyltransferase family 2 protein, partial [Pyrinomonadaceae bacterium]|nr:glycosyltransferase family 2 protein [Pyrinomonadaceae bacterium]
MQNKETAILEGTLSRRGDLEHTGWIDYVSWLSDDILLLTGWFHVPDDEPVEACLIQDGEVVPLEVRCFSYALPSLPGDVTGDPTVGKVLTARFLRAEDVDERDLGRLIISTGASTFSPRPLNISAVVDVETLIRNRLILLESQQPEKLLDFLTATPREHLGTTNIVRLCRSIANIRELLRKRLPSVPITPEYPRNFCIDNFFGINETSFYIRGWVSDPDDSFEHLDIVSPEGIVTAIAQKAFFSPRPELHEFFHSSTDVRKVQAYFTIDSPSFVTTGWVAQARYRAGAEMEVALPQMVCDYSRIREQILTDLAAPDANDEFLIRHAMPALSQLQYERQQEIKIERIAQYGLSPAAEVSIIVPLYKRIDFLEHQLAHFADDRELADSDLIYVLDSPELTEAVLTIAPHLFELYRVPFRVVILNDNFGFAAANNIGAAVARGRLLLLLNSDVFPKEPGWLGKLASFYDAKPDIGALGAKLLFEDGSLQHAGLYFERIGDTPLWTNQHYFKGYQSDLPAANVAVAVPGVTGACMMVATDLYRNLGGLGGAYVQGDYEDSDFCLRLIESGRENWYLPEVELYHLEGQSYPALLRQMAWKYNAWTQTHLRGGLIEEVMNKYPGRFGMPTQSGESSPSDLATEPVSDNDDEAHSGECYEPQPVVIKTKRSDLVELYLQTCSRS